MVLGRFLKLHKSMEKTRISFFGRMAGLLARAQIDEDLWQELEELLIGADVGVATTDQLLEKLRREAREGRVRTGQELRQALQEELVELLDSVDGKGPLLQDGQLNVVLVVGVNGVGKTTSIAKLGHLWKEQGHSVMLAAADTFRAAAIDQLRLWGEKAGLQVVAHEPGADPGSVVYDAIAAARARGADVVVVDTAGRLHTKSNLMAELQKVRRVADKQGVAHTSTLLVLDATTGQNALSQASAFASAVGLDGLVLAKLDGTAKGGAVFPIVQALKIPVLFVGTGETINDISEFDSRAFVLALFGEEGT